MKCANCGKTVSKHDCKNAQDCLELTSLSVTTSTKKLKKINQKVVKVIEQGIKIEKKVEKLKEKLNK